MNLQQLKRFVAKSESDRLEFRRESATSWCQLLTNSKKGIFRNRESAESNKPAKMSTATERDALVLDFRLDV
jgi:hypothetical protein